MIKMACDREAKWVTQTPGDVEKTVWVEELDPQKRHLKNCKSTGTI